MNEQQNMLADMVRGLLGELGPACAFDEGMARLTEIEIGGLLVPETQGGFGGSFGDAAVVFRLAGHSATALPVPEMILFRHLVAKAGLTAEGLGTVAGRSEGSISGTSFSGTLSSIPWGRNAAHVLAPAPDGQAVMLLTVSDGTLDQSANPAGEPRDQLHFENASFTRLEADLIQLGAFARAAQMAGALDAALALSVGYVNDRQQFGRPIAKFQAVQQSLATFACEAAAANCAVIGAAQALDRGDAALEVAAAKLRSNMAAGEGTAIAHQVHGAIGFTQDYALHPFTRRLWSWRSEFGADAFWSARLGDQAIAAGAEGFWSMLVDRADAG